MSDDHKTDHDILIEIANDMRWIKDSFVAHSEQDSAKFSIIENKVDSVHKRVDWLTISGVLSIIILAVSIWFKK